MADKFSTSLFSEYSNANSDFQEQSEKTSTRQAGHTASPGDCRARTSNAHEEQKTDKNSEPLIPEEVCLPPPFSHEKKASRIKGAWSVLDTAQNILRQADVRCSITGCGHRMVGRNGAQSPVVRVYAVSAEGAPVVPTDARGFSMDGLGFCSSPRCPKCAPKIANKLSGRVSSIIDACDSKGWFVGFLTLTIKHDKDTVLADMRKLEAEVWRKLRDGGGMNRRRRDGLLGMVRTFEVTAGPGGWHLHIHALVIHKGGNELLMETGSFLIERWIRLVTARGGVATTSAQNFQVMQRGSGKISDYGAKTLRGWGLAAEMAGEWYKKGRRPNRLSIPELLGFASHGDKWAAARYVEAVQALSGLRLLYLSKNIKDELGLEDNIEADAETVDQVSIDELTGEILEDKIREKVDAALVYEITAPLWDSFIKNRIRGDVMALLWKCRVRERKTIEDTTVALDLFLAERFQKT